MFLRLRRWSVCRPHQPVLEQMMAPQMIRISEPLSLESRAMGLAAGCLVSAGEEGCIQKYLILLINQKLSMLVFIMFKSALTFNGNPFRFYYFNFMIPIIASTQQVSHPQSIYLIRPEFTIR